MQVTETRQQHAHPVHAAPRLRVADNSSDVTSGIDGNHDITRPTFRQQGLLGMQLRMMAGMSAQTLAKMGMARASSVDDPEMKKQIQALGKIPLYILVPMLESYTKGTLPIFESAGSPATGRSRESASRRNTSPS